MFKWYNNTDNKLMFRKSPVLLSTDETSIIFGDNSILTPMIKAKSYDGNYVYIEQFARYYFISDVIFSKGYYYIKCTVDPYFSFYEQTKNINALVVRNENDVNTDIVDSAMMLKASIQTSSENFGETLSYNNDVPYIIGVI